MNPLEALNLLVQAAARAWLPRQDHVQIEQAAVVLEGVIKKKSNRKRKAEPAAEDAPASP